MSPANLISLFGLAAFIPLCIASCFAFVGAALILPFAGLELCGLAWAFWAQARHATDREKIRLSGRGQLLIEIRSDGRTSRYEFDPAKANITESRQGGSYRLFFASDNGEVELGRHWDGERRKALATTLRQWLVTLKTSS